MSNIAQLSILGKKIQSLNYFACRIDDLPCVLTLHWKIAANISQKVDSKVTKEDHPRTVEHKPEMLRHNMDLHDDVFMNKMMPMTPSSSSIGLGLHPKNQNMAIYPGKCKQSHLQ
jgi:hypothetical protein